MQRVDAWDHGKNFGLLDAAAVDFDDAAESLSGLFREARLSEDKNEPGRVRGCFFDCGSLRE